MSWFEVMFLGSLRGRILEKTFTPLIIFIGIWILLSVSRAFLPKKYTIWMAITGAAGFLIWPVDRTRGLGLWTELTNFQCVVCGVCGLGLALYAFRLEGLKIYRGNLSGRVGFLVIISAMLFFSTLFRVFRLFQ